MSEEEKPKKRVGSWREYLDYLLGKSFLCMVGIILMAGSILVILGLMLLLMMQAFLSREIPQRLDIVAMLFCLVLFLGGLAWIGKKSWDIAQNIPPVLPPTRRNLATSSLPAQDVLVRASAEPTEEAGKTLLRGAVKDGETPAEELLRPL